MVQTRFALILYFRMVAHKAACHTLSKAFLKSMKTWYRFCWCWRYFSHRILRLKICSVVLSGSEPSLFFSNYFFSLGFKPIQDNFQHDFAWMTVRLIVLYFWQSCKLPFLAPLSWSLRGDLIVWEASVIRPHFQTTYPLKPLGQM